MWAPPCISSRIYRSIHCLASLSAFCLAPCEVATVPLALRKLAVCHNHSLELVFAQSWVRCLIRLSGVLSMLRVAWNCFPGAAACGGGLRWFRWDVGINKIVCVGVCVSVHAEQNPGWRAQAQCTCAPSIRGRRRHSFGRAQPNMVCLECFAAERDRPQEVQAGGTAACASKLAIRCIDVLEQLKQFRGVWRPKCHGMSGCRNKSVLARHVLTLVRL